MDHRSERLPCAVTAAAAGLLAGILIAGSIHAGQPSTPAGADDPRAPHGAQVRSAPAGGDGPRASAGGESGRSGDGYTSSPTSEQTMNLRETAELLLEYWSRKDAAAVASLLCEDAVVIGPLAPGGRMQGADAIRRFLDAQNTDRASLPAEEQGHHAMMARSKARVKRVIEQANSIALEADLVSGTDGTTREAALFIDVDPQCRIKSVNIYFNARPNLHSSGN
jgi:hypothetical protein